MNNKNYSVTFKDLIIYGRNYYGPIENAGSFTFDNVDYTGSEMVYTTVSSNITFKNFLLCLYCSNLKIHS